MFDKNIWTFGSEIEAADWDTRKSLPEGCVLDLLDYTIANSNGLANDPKKKINVFGGELSPRVSSSPEEAVEAMIEAYNSIYPYSLNYTCNLHMHVGVPGLIEDLESMKKLVDYIYNNQVELFEEVLPAIPRPDKSDKPAMLRFRQRNKSHRHKITETIHREKMEATTIDEFEMAHKPYKNGSFAAANAIRPGVNTNSLFKHGTIEFRHFPGDDNPETLLWCFTWCMEFLNCALNRPEVSPKMLLEELGGEFKMAEFRPFDHEIDKVFKATHFDKHSRKKIQEYYKENGYEDFSSLPR